MYEGAKMSTLALKQIVAKASAGKSVLSARLELLLKLFSPLVASAEPNACLLAQRGREQGTRAAAAAT